ncbi:Fms-interacting protein-domain-containing protein [Sphaerosporella brunnea]|uniref:Fms-interacting protein-domain-containing protein n=1 Tax=Sphaerosporella brunnea TaxID=1250544 RepID=A0A5J5EVW9_9PEZI|nr:Fms-interacting protein-domain-containing protein [Sphaerosporella brunnea]
MAIQYAAIDQDRTVAHFLEVAERTRQLCHEIISALEAASDGEPSDQVQAERLRQRKQLNALVMQLKSLHRSAIMSSREAKKATGKACQEVDRLHLQLQNLYYEQRHLRGEKQCLQGFPVRLPHKYTSLPLIPVEKFLAQHPEFQQTDPHNLMIARLKNWKVVREELEKQRKELLIEKQALIAENKKRKDDLDSLDEQLKKFSKCYSVCLSSTHCGITNHFAVESSRSIQTTFQKDY